MGSRVASRAFNGARLIADATLAGLRMFALFERLLKPAVAPETPEPPPGLVAFYWHFARQAKPLFAALFVVGFFHAVLDTMIPLFIGRVVTLVTTANPATLFAEHGTMLLGMA